MKRTFSVVGIAALAISTIGVGLFGNTATAAITTTDQVTLSLTVDQNISLDCGADVDLGTLVAGTPVNGTTTCTTTTNAEAGYDLAVRRDDADTTLDKTTSASDNITDKTAWSSSTPNAIAWSGTGLGFRVQETGTTATYNSTWWGSEADASNTYYAGFPTAYETIMDHDGYAASSTAVVVAYRVDVPGTQRSGAYDGSITYQATTKP